MKKVAILQSNYIPWKGYFDMIAAVDEFILYDDMQYTRRDWRNRNRIKTPQGVKWLTVPVLTKGNYYQAIRDVNIADSEWAAIHWQALSKNYGRALFFRDIATWLEPLYRSNSYTSLSELNRCFIEEVCCYLNIKTIIKNSWDYTLIDGKTERLADLCLQAGGTEYISGPAAKNYIEEDVFLKKGIKLTWFDYANYPEYPQMWGAFTHEVTIFDLLFHCGQQASHYMKYL